MIYFYLTISIMIAIGCIVPALRWYGKRQADLNRERELDARRAARKALDQAAYNETFAEMERRGIAA